ncbi:BspA family leucine-rich repeat surface protein [Muricauda sp. JGD-17]|uniref:BspA family leucine-rich repeat surface protein n=1 Tax=Flagellimonas ochracea TaxID=2696472 RepID=A0A964WXY1_9FLAO|nr:BspA family leucine-rich repeat surface protein [Allomuricauda ochracea]NAY92636.1 BspA family leucine-rich repeat surface protein [Allomuricauda ochracea]
MVKNYLTLLFLFSFSSVFSQAFITTWKTDNPGASADNQITIPTFSGEIYNYTIDWGDGTSNTNVTGDITHTYGLPGTYQVSISGTFPRIFFNFFPEDEAKDYEKLLSVDQWGSVQWSSMDNAFARCSNLDIKAVDIPDLSNVTSMSLMFRGCSSLIGNDSFSVWDVSNVNAMFGVFLDAPLFNQDIGGWDVSNVTDMGAMFSGATSFNQDIGAWDVSQVTRMVNMFSRASSFNQDIGGWDVSLVDDMSSMFFEANSFNSDINGWDVSNVTNMTTMFLGNQAFNQPLDNWDVSGVTSMALMFFFASEFNQDISSWDVSNVTGMNGMFQNAASFDQDLSAWDVSNVTDMDLMFFDTKLSTANYDKLLKGWSSLPSLQNNVIFHAGNSQYCGSVDERQSIIDTYGWTITDDGPNSECFFMTTWKTDNPGGSEDNQISIPTFPGEAYNYTVDWGDGTIDTNVSGSIVHSFDQSGIYEVRIRGQFPAIYFANQGDAQKLLSIDQWGHIKWENMIQAFKGCSNMDVLAVDIPDFSNTTNISGMFANCTALEGNDSFENWDVSGIDWMAELFNSAEKFNQDIGSWDVGNVRSMGSMFIGASSFNQDIGGWDVGNVSTMQAMFQGAESFNQDIGGWDVGNVETMLQMFAGARAFNQDIGNWNVSSVNRMASMFGSAAAFNQDISGWDVSNVTDMSTMFLFATSFNYDFDGWDVSNVIDMGSMFQNASAFDQDLSLWDVSNVTDMTSMFLNTGLSLINYDRTLNAWADLPNLQTNVAFNAGSSQFCESAEARQFIIDTYGWNVMDGGESPLCNQDNDGDGVFDHKDDCLNTLPGVAVNNNGCDFVPNDAIQVFVSTPSCTGSSDGSIEVTTSISGYLLDISIEGTGVSDQFDDVDSDEGLKIDDLPVGSYTVVISIPEILFEQTYGVSVNEIDSVSGKRSQLDTKARTASYIVSGSKTYEVSINGESNYYSFESTESRTLVLENLMGQNEVVISGENDCQGNITDSFFVGDAIQIYPTISSSDINLLTSSDKVGLRIYSLEGRLVKELHYDQKENNVDISMLESGLYIFLINVDGREETLKVIKR